MEGVREYMRLNSVTVSKYVKMPFFSPIGTHRIHIYHQKISTCIHTTNGWPHTDEPKCKRLHPTLLSALSEIVGVCCQGVFRDGQSVSVISVYVSSQSWEWHETHKASLCQPCGLQQLVPPQCHRKNAHISEKKIVSVFMLVFSKCQEEDMLKA